MARATATVWTACRWLLLGLGFLISSGLAGNLSCPPGPPAADFTAAAVVKVPGPIAAQSMPGDRNNADSFTRSPAGKTHRTPGKRPWIARTPDLQQLEAVVQKNARQQAVAEDLVWAVMRRESGFNPAALSPKGAMGLMQLMPGTAAMLGVADPYNVEQNVAGGVKYLRLCLDYFDQDIDLALAAYNAGPGNVAKHRGVPPFAETINYVAAVLKDFIAQVRPGGHYRNPQDPGQLGESGCQASGLNWRVPIPRWRIARPQDKVGAPRWQGRIMAAGMRGRTLVSLGKKAQSPKAQAGGRNVSSL